MCFLMSFSQPNLVCLMNIYYKDISYISQALNEMGEDLRCEWLAEEECFKLEKREKHNVYVFEEFGCEAFEHVVSTNNKWVYCCWMSLNSM